MPKITKELSDAHKNEIMAACVSLYEKMSFKDITIKEISKLTSIARSSIYNYFHTKEEIFLEIFKREYEYWIADLTAIADDHEQMTSDEFANALAESLDKRHLLLKLLSMNMYDMEENSSMPKLVEFKKAYGNSMKAVNTCLSKFFPNMTEFEKQEFIFTFFPFIYGIYPYTFVTEKQRTAMKRAGAEYKFLTVHEIAYMELKKLLSVY